MLYAGISCLDIMASPSDLLEQITSVVYLQQNILHSEIDLLEQITSVVYLLLSEFKLATPENIDNVYMWQYVGSSGHCYNT